MAKYLIRESASVTLDPVTGVSEYYTASMSEPREIEIPDDVEPSDKWKPLDEAARKAKKKLADFRALPPEKKLELREKEKVDAEAEDSKKAEAAAVAAKQHDKEAAAHAEKGKKPASPL